MEPNNIVPSNSKEKPNSSSSREFSDSSSSLELLVEACANGQMDVIDSLLELGVDVNALASTGMGPLHQSCMQTQPWVIDVVTKLIIHGADVDSECNVPDNSGCNFDSEGGWNAIDFALAASPFQPHVAQLLLDCSKKGVNRLDFKHFNYLWVTESLKAIKFLVKNGIDINHVNFNTTYLNVAPSDEIEYLRSVGAKLCSEL